MTRAHPLVRLAAIVLLTWTMLDLSMPGLCELDNEDRAAQAQGPASVATEHAPGQAAAPHVDDCFCCSGCVALPASLVLVAGTDHPDFPAYVASLPPAPASTLDHPPQLG